MLTSSIRSNRFPGLALGNWVQFDGATGTVRKSNSVTGVVRNGAGDYTISLPALPNTNYVIAVSTDAGGSWCYGMPEANRTTGSFELLCYSRPNLSLLDPDSIWVGVYR